MMQNNFTPINKMTAGETYNLPVLVIDMTERTARTGNAFVAFKFTDGETVINVNAFSCSLEDMKAQGIHPGCIAEVSLYIKDPYYNLSDITLCENPDIRIEDFVRKAPGNPEDMLEEIRALIYFSAGKDGSMEITTLTAALLDKYSKEYCRSSAAKEIHHNLLGGLLYHSYRMVLAAASLCNVYTSLDRELLICAAAIHDIGKITELCTTTTGEAYYTVAGRLFGHAEIGIEMINEEAARLGFFSERISLLKHCVASHHGKPEWGAMVPPAIIEAEALHLIDMMDARMYQFEDTYARTQKGKLSGKVFGLDNSTVYVPDYNPFEGLFEEGALNEA